MQFSVHSVMFYKVHYITQTRYIYYIVCICRNVGQSLWPKYSPAPIFFSLIKNRKLFIFESIRLIHCQDSNPFIRQCGLEQRLKAQNNKHYKQIIKRGTKNGRKKRKLYRSV